MANGPSAAPPPQRPSRASVPCRESASIKSSRSPARVPEAVSSSTGAPASASATGRCSHIHVLSVPSKSHEMCGGVPPFQESGASSIAYRVGLHAPLKVQPLLRRAAVRSHGAAASGRGAPRSASQTDNGNGSTCRAPSTSVKSPSTPRTRPPISSTKFPATRQSMSRTSHPSAVEDASAWSVKGSSSAAPAGAPGNQGRTHRASPPEEVSAQEPSARPCSSRNAPDSATASMRKVSSVRRVASGPVWIAPRNVQSPAAGKCTAPMRIRPREPLASSTRP